MLTRWSDQALSDVPLNEYPRPQLQRDNWLNLNGLWRYAITDKQAAPPSTWDGEIRVPFCAESKLSGVERGVSSTQRLWYQRDLDFEDTDLRTLLHFGAVDYECAIWINDGFVGAHTGGFDGFSFDITEYLHGSTNTLTVAVCDPSNGADQPRGKQHQRAQDIWYTTVTGIWQTVWIEQVPLQAHIEEIILEPSIDCQAVDCTVMLARSTRSPELAVEVLVTLAGKAVTREVMRPDRRVRIEIPQAQLWSPDTPTLYDAQIRLLRIGDPFPPDNDQQELAQLTRKVPLRGAQENDVYTNVETLDAEMLDSVQTYFGLRCIERGPHPEHGHPALLLNGQALFQLGPLDQGWWPDGLHTPACDEALIYDLEYLKAAGFNTIRKHVKVESARYYYHCDRLGLLVWQDMPSAFLPGQFVAPNDEGEGVRSSRSSIAYEAELHHMVCALRNHPSIIMWVIHNEGWGQFDSARLCDGVRGLDPSRLINATSGWLDVGVGDVIDRHDYAADPRAPEADGERALVLGEYGGLALPIKEHLWNPDMRNWGYQGFADTQTLQDAYEHLIHAIVSLRDQHMLCAAIYTQTSDVEGEVNGLLTYDRALEKFPAAWLRQVHAPLTE